MWINDADIAIGMRINEQPAGNANKRRITGGKTNLETPKSRKIGCKGVSQRGRKKSVNKGGRGIMRQNPCLVKGERTVKMLVRNLKSAVCNLPAKDHTHGFTLVEIIIVVVILSIAAVMMVPMMSSAGSMQIRSAANMIAADLEYAKSMAITRQKNYSVVFIFNPPNNYYEIHDPNGIIEHPVKKGFGYKVDFSTDRQLGKVKITAVDFGSTSQVVFQGNALGSPDNGGSVTIQADGTTATIKVEAITGFISIQGI